MNPPHHKQRLAAILAADAAGYSRLIGIDAQGTVHALDAARTVFHEQITRWQGRGIDMAGDSVLAVFETAVGAASAALAIQQNLCATAAELPEDRRMLFRIGLHLGDVIEKPDGSIYGDGVNIAARLQSLADPGRISVSDTIHGVVRGKLDASFDDRGEHSVKNIAYPVRLFCMHLPGAAMPPANGGVAVPAQPPAEIAANAQHRGPSIAVLPFTNMSGDAEQEYFSDGISEDIITDLCKIGGLMVVARSSSLRLQEQEPGHPGCRARTRRAFCARRFDPARRQPGPDYGTTDRSRHWRPSVGRTFRSRDHRHLRGTG
jgi:adenylate cyclase